MLCTINTIMETELEKINKQYSDGKITKIEFGPDYKTCYLDFVGHKYVDNEKSELFLRLTFTSCIQFLFSSLDYQFAKRKQDFLRIIAWGLDPNNDHVDKFFLEEIDDEPISTPYTMSKVAKNLKHYYFQGFEANIDIIAGGVEIEKGESGV